MLFIIQALYYSKCQIHFLSFIDIHKSLDYVRCFFGVLQRACDVRHGVSSTSMNQVIDAMLSAHRASFFLNSDCIVSPTRTMFVQESHVRGLVGRVVITLGHSILPWNWRQSTWQSNVLRLKCPVPCFLPVPKARSIVWVICFWHALL
jgi:hypothetical protein